MKQTLQTVAAERLKQLKKDSKLLSNEEELRQDQTVFKTFFYDVAPNNSEESQSENELSKAEVCESKEKCKNKRTTLDLSNFLKTIQTSPCKLFKH